MQASWKIFSFKGITVKIHFTFLLLLAWIIIVNIIAGMQLSDIIWSLVFVLAVFASVVLHEYGHALVAARYGINARNITLYPIGGIASIEKLPEDPRQELLISAAGPIVSLVLASVLMLFAPQSFSIDSFRLESGVIDSSNFIFTLSLVNFSLAIFNLIPAFPMDGGRILRALLAHRMNYIKATAVAATIGRAIAVIFIVMGLISFHLLLMLVGVFVILFASAEESYLRLRTLLKGIRLNEVVMYDYNSIPADISVSEAAVILENNHGKYFIVMENGLPVGTLNRIEVIKAMAERNYEQQVGELMKENIVFLDGNREVNDVVDKLAAREEKIFPVMLNGNFIGVVSFQNIIEYILIHKASTKEYDRARSLAGLV